MRLGYDLSILRHPLGGTARYAVGMLEALRASTAPGDEIIVERAWRRVPRGHRVGRYANLGSDLAWLMVGVPVAAARARINVWYSPSNIISPTLRRPAVVTIHDVNFLVDRDAYDRRYARYAEAMFRRSAIHARHVVTDSEFSRGQIISAFAVDPERVSVLYPGLDHTRRPAAAGGSPDALREDWPEPYCLFVGQTEPHKNVGLLLEAWETGVPRGLHLVIAGPPGRDDAGLRLRAEQASLRGRIHFAGRVTEPELRNLYQRAACFLLPSRAEGFGFSALEAMAHGVPTAVARAGSLPEVTAGAAATFDPDDPNELRDVVTQLVEDSHARERAAADGVQVARRYKWSTAAAGLWQLLRPVGLDAN